jgi:hypothetical protein
MTTPATKPPSTTRSQSIFVIYRLLAALAAAGAAMHAATEKA